MSAVHVATPQPKKSSSAVRMSALRKRARATTCQSLGSRGSRESASSLSPSYSSSSASTTLSSLSRTAASQKRSTIPSGKPLRTRMQPHSPLPISQEPGLRHYVSCFSAATSFTGRSLLGREFHYLATDSVRLLLVTVSVFIVNR